VPVACGRLWSLVPVPVPVPVPVIYVACACIFLFLFLFTGYLTDNATPVKRRFYLIKFISNDVLRRIRR
jgi:hypothetical protein